MTYRAKKRGKARKNQRRKKEGESAKEPAKKVRHEIPKKKHPMGMVINESHLSLYRSVLGDMKTGLKVGILVFFILSLTSCRIFKYKHLVA